MSHFYLPNPRAPERDINITFNKKQKTLLDIIADKKKTDIMAYGSAGGGKTFTFAVAQIFLCLKYPLSKHFAGRFSLTSCKRSLWRQTYMPILKTLEDNHLCNVNNTEGSAEFLNGAFIGCIGLQPSDVENSSLLSLEFDTGFIGEANENDYSTIEYIRTRMRGNRLGRDPQLFMDMNPTTFSHWSYQVFLKGLNPESKLPLTDFEHYATLQFKTEDNPTLPQRYIESLKNLSPVKKRRFYDGNFGYDADALFDEPIFYDDLPADFPLVAYLDPAFSATKQKTKKRQPDYSALTVGGRYKGKVYIIAGYIWRSEIGASYNFIEKVCKRFGVRVLHYEDNQARGSIGFEMSKRGIATAAKWNYREKHARIMDTLDKNWLRVLWNPELKTNKEMLPYYQNVMSYSELDSINDDAPDSAAGLCEILIDKAVENSRIGQFGQGG